MHTKNSRTKLHNQNNYSTKAFFFKPKLLPFRSDGLQFSMFQMENFALKLCSKAITQRAIRYKGRKIESDLPIVKAIQE